MANVSNEANFPNQNIRPSTSKLISSNTYLRPKKVRFNAPVNEGFRVPCTMSNTDNVTKQVVQVSDEQRHPRVGKDITNFIISPKGKSVIKKRKEGSSDLASQSSVEGQPNVNFTGDQMIKQRKTVSDNLTSLESKLKAGPSILPSNGKLNKLRLANLSLLNKDSDEDIVIYKNEPTNVSSIKTPDVVHAEVEGPSQEAPRNRLSPPDEYFNTPEFDKMFRELMDRVNKTNSEIKPWKKPPESYSCPEEYINDFSITAKNLTKDIVALDNKMSVVADNFPENNTIKQLYKSTELVYSAYGGVHDVDQAKPNWKLDSQNDKEAIDMLAQPEKAYNLKKRFEDMSQRLFIASRRQPPEISEISFSLGLSQEDDISSSKMSPNSKNVDPSIVIQDVISSMVSDSKDDDSDSRLDSPIREENDHMNWAPRDYQVLTRRRIGAILGPSIRSPFLRRDTDTLSKVPSLFRKICAYLFVEYGENSERG